MRGISVRTLAGAAVGLGLAASTTLARANFNETESNDTRATANLIGPMVAGDTITGNSVSGSGVGLDYLDVQIGALPLAIYRHRLTITTTGTAGHTGSIRGIGQAGVADTLPGIPWDGVVGAGTTALDNTLQSSSTATTPPRYNQWYGFGKGETVAYRVVGTASTTADYVATLDTALVTPVNIGNFAPGQISITTFGQGHSSDTDFWVYDSNLDPIRGYGNDDEAVLGGSPGTGGTLQGWLSRAYTPGTYYIALSNFNVANNQFSPSDDDFRTGSLLDRANMVLNTSTATGTNLTFTVADSTGSNSVQTANTKAGAYDVNWFCFTVVPSPGATALFGVAGLVSLRRRR